MNGPDWNWGCLAILVMVALFWTMFVLIIVKL